MLQLNCKNDITQSKRSSNERFAGRSAVGSDYAVTLSKDGQQHIRLLPNGQMHKTIACGLACSEVVSGRNLASVLQSGFEYERKVLEDLMNGVPAQPLSIHTSAGVPAPLSDFIDELELHLPWRLAETEVLNDWCLSLQMEGASAVLAAVDMLTQLKHEQYMESIANGSIIEDSPKPISSWKIGVGTSSYHGPPSTSPGGITPLTAFKHGQIMYPVPPCNLEGEGVDTYLTQFSQWMETNGESLACLLVEPQWGSSRCGLPWNKNILNSVVDIAHGHGVLVLADEIMCGLGRHGQGTLFLSEAWGLDVDAVTFGKAIAAGAYPMSGAILRRGAAQLGATGRTVMQSHTYSGGNVRALLTATAVLKLLPSLYSDVESKGRQIEEFMRLLGQKSGGMFQIHGMGLLWGALLSPAVYNGLSNVPPIKEFMPEFKKQCHRQGVLPYFVPVGGFLVTPLFDVDTDTIAAIGTKLIAAYEQTMAQLSCVDLCEVVDLPDCPESVSPSTVPLAVPIAVAITGRTADSVGEASVTATVTVY